MRDRVNLQIVLAEIPDTNRWKVTRLMPRATKLTPSVELLICALRSVCRAEAHTDQSVSLQGDWFVLQRRNTRERTAYGLRRSKGALAAREHIVWYMSMLSWGPKVKKLQMFRAVGAETQVSRVPWWRIVVAGVAAGVGRSGSSRDSSGTGGETDPSAFDDAEEVGVRTLGFGPRLPLRREKVHVRWRR
jgi:hypothetical protein